MSRIVLLCVILVSCTDDGVSLQDLPSRLETALCKASVTCGVYPDDATCRASYQANGSDLKTLSAAVDAGLVKFDSQAAQRCLDELANQSCAYDGVTRNDPCADVFVGLVPVGGSCFQSEECLGRGSCKANDAICDRSVSCCPGTCQAAHTAGPIGAACESTLDCQDDAYCAGTHTCTALATGEGAACDGLLGCAGDLLCKYDATAGQYTTCFRPAARGAACDPTQFLACADNRDYCHPTTNTCTPVPGVGEACGAGASSQCVNYATCSNGTCVARPTAGEACTDDCLGDLHCTNGTCAMPPSMTCM